MSSGTAILFVVVVHLEIVRIDGIRIALLFCCCCWRLLLLALVFCVVVVCGCCCCWRLSFFTKPITHFKKAQYKHKHRLGLEFLEEMFCQLVRRNSLNVYNAQF